jgi:hypothetical protein
MRCILVFLGLFLLPGIADACTTLAFIDPARPVMAYNFDFHIGQGAVLVNKSGLAKMSETEGNPARWLARYASVTFVMFGRDSPMTGMMARVKITPRIAAIHAPKSSLSGGFGRNTGILRA